MTQLFKRQVRVELGNATDALVFPNDFKIAFSIQHQLSAKSGSGTVTLYNLSDSTKEFIREAGQRIRVFAGYEDDVGLLHDGTILRTEQIDEGSNRLTVISLDQNIFIANQDNFSKSYRGNILVRQIVKDAVSTLGAIDFSQQSLEVIPDKAVLNNYSFGGKTLDALTELLTPFDIEWHIDLNEMKFNKIGEAFNQNNIVVLNKDSGLIKTAVQTDRGINAVSLMNSRLRVGSVVKIESDVVENASFNAFDKDEKNNATGFYKINQCDFSGDNWDGKFRVAIQCSIFNNTLAQAS